MKVIFVYGVLGSSSFCNLHNQIIKNEYLKNGNTKYIFRHAYPGFVNSTINTINHNKKYSLQGYGVFLDIKNMEYKNVDDSSESSNLNY